MNILIYNPAASYGGALSILQDFMSDIVDDDINTYHLLVTTKNEINDIVKTKKNIKIINIDGYKRSFFHRFYWDQYNLLKYAKINNIDHIVSLQNTCNLFGTMIPQTVYMHQPRPFFVSEFKRFFTKKEVIVTHLRDLYMRLSAKRASNIIVQTNWYKEAVSKRYTVSESKISVVSPKIKVGKVNEEEIPTSVLALIRDIKDNEGYLGVYIASPNIYKNIEVLLNFVKAYNNKQDEKIYLLIPFMGDENEYAKKILKSVGILDIRDYIKFIGKQNRSTVYYLLSESDALFFPSIIETYGLPLKEAMVYNTRVFASDLEYAKEVCGNYAKYFNPFSANDLLTVFQENKYYEVSEEKIPAVNDKSYYSIIEDIMKNHNNQS